MNKIIVKAAEVGESRGGSLKILLGTRNENNHGFADSSVVNGVLYLPPEDGDSEEITIALVESESDMIPESSCDYRALHVKRGALYHKYSLIEYGKSYNVFYIPNSLWSSDLEKIVIKL